MEYKTHLLWNKVGKKKGLITPNVYAPAKYVERVTRKGWTVTSYDANNDVHSKRPFLTAHRKLSYGSIGLNRVQTLKTFVLSILHPIYPFIISLWLQGRCYNHTNEADTPPFATPSHCCCCVFFFYSWWMVFFSPPFFFATSFPNCCEWMICAT